MHVLRERNLHAVSFVRGIQLLREYLLTALEPEVGKFQDCLQVMQQSLLVPWH